MKSKTAIRAIQYCSFSSERSPKRQRAIPLATPSFQSDTELESPWPAFRLYTRSRIEDIFAHYAPKVDPRPFVSASVVFPMRVNNYVLDNLIDWSRVPDDPVFRLVFPQPEMLSAKDLSTVSEALSRGDTTRVSLREIAENIRSTLNAHPAGQKEENVPILNGCPVPGMQHKYKETVLFFPLEGQFCHTYCTYCFRWAQFTSVGSPQQFKSNEALLLRHYLLQHPQVTDVLFTGGDPMVMSAAALRKYIMPLFTEPGIPHLSTVRIGTKSLAYWPMRYVSDPDSKDLLDLFTEVCKAGKQLAVQAHFSHPKELQTPVVQEAIRLIRMTGAQIRCQAPLIRNVNDHPDIWAEMWTTQARLGLIPYYMFIERDTGARHYFSVPLATAYKVFSQAYAKVGGTSRTVRGPSMSASPGKITVVGVEKIGNQKVFVLKFLQARIPSWTERVFFAEFDPHATWIDELKPGFGEKEFFFEEGYRKIAQRNKEGSSGQLVW